MKRALTLTIFMALAIGLVWWLRGRGHETPAGGGDHRSVDLPATPSERAQPAGDSQSLPALADDDPRGTLRLEGLVLGADDHPVAGATVTLGSNPPRTATSEADGSFAFDQLVTRSYRLVARAPAGVAGPVVAHLTDKSEPVVLHLRVGSKLAVTVVTADAKPIDGATVELRGADQQAAETKAGVATFAPVVPGNYEIVAFAPGTAKAYQSVRVAGDSHARIMLAAGAPAAGRVVDEHGKPVGGAHVVFVAASGFRVLTDPRLDAAISGADGSWRFAALPAGSFRFVASDSEHAAGTSSLVTLDGATEKTGIVVTLAPGAAVRGRVIDSAKVPVVGARIQIEQQMQRGRIANRLPPRQGYSDAHGEFEIRGLPRGPLSAVASADQGASSGVELDTTNGDVKDVVIALDLTAVIAGVVVDPQGQAIEGAQVMAVAQTFDLAMFRGGGANIETTDAAGRFRISGLATGKYTLHASRSAPMRGGRRGRRGGADGIDAETGNERVRIELPAEGAVKGKVAFSDGHPPIAFTIGVDGTEQAFTGTDTFAIDALAPGDYTLQVRGPSFDTRDQAVTIEPGKPTDVGTILLAAGRRLAGTVMSAGQPVAGATVYAGRQVMGGGASNDGPMGGFGGLVNSGTKQDTSDATGAFALAGFGDGDLTIIADLPSIGRSTPLRVTEEATNQTSLVLELQKYGAISGVLRQGGQPVPSTPVTVQSTSTPGAMYIVMAGADGAYRFDQLAPDTYKVSATIGNPRRGIKFYSQQVVVPPGQEVSVDLVVDPGSVTVQATPVSAKGQVGIAIAYLAGGTIIAATSQDLALRLAAAGPGSSQMVIARGGSAAEFDAVAPGSYSICVVPLPLEVKGFGAIGYVDRHGSKLPCFCKQLAVAPSPPAQSIQVAVEVPPMIPDGGGGTGGNAPAGP